MIAEFMGHQIDYFLFGIGLAFFVLSGICFYLFKERKKDLPWVLMMVFALVQGVNSWVSCITFAFGDGPLFPIFSPILEAISFIFLFEFGRVGLMIVAGKKLSRWAHLPLLVLASLGGLSGVPGLQASIHYVYGLCGGFLSSFVLYRAYKTWKIRPLAYIAFLMCGYALAAGAIVPKAGFFPASVTNQIAFFHWTGIPIEFFIGAIGLGLAFTVWKYYRAVKPTIASEEGSQSKNLFQILFVFLFVIFLVASWGLANFAGNLASQTDRENILQTLKLAQVVIKGDEFKNIQIATEYSELLAYQDLRQSLIDIRESNSTLRDVYLMVKKANWIYFSVDGHPVVVSDYRIPGTFYESPPPGLFDVFTSGNSQVIGPYTDNYGTFISGYAAIYDQARTTVVGVLGIDIDATFQQRLIGKYRLVSFGFTILGFAIFIGYFTVRQKNWEVAQRIAFSEKNLAQAQTLAKIGSWTWNVNPEYLFWSEEMYRIFSRPIEEKVHTLQDFQAYFSDEDWEVFQATVRNACQEGEELEQESKIILPNQTGRYIIFRARPRMGPDGKIIQLLGTSQDVTESKETFEKIRKLSRVVEQSPISVVITDTNGSIEYVNPKFTEYTGYSFSEAIGKNPRILKSGETSTEEYARLWNTIQSGKEWVGEFRNKKKNGEFFWENAVISPIFDEYGAITHYVGIKEDITEQKKIRMELINAHKELEKTNRELEKASLVKSQFLANMSHEIRTPLNAIIGMTGLLLDTPLNPEQSNYAETVRTSGEVLLALINDILDFSKIEAEKMELENQSFELRSCIEEALDLVVTKASEKKIELAYLIKDELPTFFVGDVTRLRQILVNLLSNAVKFTESGEVVISVIGQLRDQRQYQLHFSVRDTGMGIPPDRADRLFQTFSQIDASTTRRFGGTGLGLAISKHLSELMGGTMWVESTGVPGEGSTFHFTILAQEALKQEPDANHERMPVDLMGLHILIVDDNPTNCEILEHYTQSWKMVPTIAGSGRVALDLIQNEGVFDLAILDLQMPEMDGVTLAKEIHARLQKDTFPLILLSSLGYREAQSDETLFNAILTKPIKPSQLFDSLGASLNSIWVPVKQKFNASTERPDSDLGQQHPLRILVVDDNTVNQNVALSFLGKVGYRADVASNGIEALQALDRQTYDLVFMDGQMPEMDGEEATRLIRQQLPPEQQPYIVAMTANAMQGDRERYLGCGMNDYISKPIRMKELVRAITVAQPLRPPSGSVHEPIEESGSEIMKDSPPLTPSLFEPGLPAAAAEGEQPKVLNPQTLQEFQEVMGEDGKEMVVNLINLYIEDSQDLIAKMRQDLVQNECDSLRRDAHTLKGNSYQIGAEVLAGRCFDLEKLAKTGATAGAENLISQIQSDYERVRVDLSMLIDMPGV